MSDKARFIRVKCPNLECNKEQVIFGKATITVRCVSCNTILSEPRGGKAKLKAKVLEVLI